MVAGAGELVGATTTVVVEETQAAGSQVVHGEAVAAPGLHTEMAHDRLPFLPVGPDAAAVDGEGDQMGNLMRDGLSQECLRLAGQ